MIEVVKYIVEGLTVALASHLVSGGRLDIKELTILGITAAAVFLVLEMFSPSVANGARQGAGFGIGYGLVNEGHRSYHKQRGGELVKEPLYASQEQTISQEHTLSQHNPNVPYKLVDGQYSAKILLAGFNENAKGYNYETNCHAPFDYDSTEQSGGAGASKNRLNTGETLTQDDSLSSTNGLYRLTLQSDGNLVLYDTLNKAQWNTATNGKGKAPYKLVMQTDNNLVLYDSANTPLWSTRTQNKPGVAYLTLQDDRNVCVYNNQGTLWCSMSQLKPGETPPPAVVNKPSEPIVVGQLPTLAMQQPTMEMSEQKPAPTMQQPTMEMSEQKLAPMMQQPTMEMSEQKLAPTMQQETMAEMSSRRMMPIVSANTESRDTISYDKNYRNTNVLYSGDIIDITSGDLYLQRGTIDSQIIFDKPLPKVGTNLSKIRFVHPKHRTDRQTALRYGESVYIMHNAYFNNVNLNKYIKHGDRLQSHQEGSLFRAFKIYDAINKDNTGPVEIGKDILLARGDQEGENVYTQIEADKSVSSKSSISKASRLVIKLRRVYETGNRNLCIYPRDTLYP